MPAATNSIRAIPKKPSVMRGQPGIPLSIAPRGNRSLMPTIKRAPRMPPRPNTRDYGKGDFTLPGYKDE